MSSTHPVTTSPDHGGNTGAARHHWRKPATSALMIAGLLGTTGLIAHLLTAGAAAEAEQRQQTARARLLPVEAHVARLETGYARQRQLPGLVTARRSVALGFQVPGQIASLGVDEGDTVTQGTALAQLDTDRLNANRARLQAALLEARASARLAHSTMTRQRDLNKRGHASDQVLDQAAADTQRADAAVRVIKAEIAALDVDLADSTLTAPFAGTITGRQQDEGAVVAAGQPVLTLLETGALEARIGIPPILAETLRPGKSYPVRIGAHVMQARLISVLPTVSRDTRTRLAILALPADSGATNGQLAQLNLGDRVAQPGFWLPDDALTEGLRGLWTAYRLVPVEGQPGAYLTQRVEVELLHAENGRNYVAGTLADGDLLVWHGAQRLTDGQTVRPTEAPSG